MSFLKLRNMILISICAAAWTLSSFAQPSITGVSGTLSDGATLTITGSNFGTKSPAQPQLWANFKTGPNPSSLGLITSWSNWSTSNYNYSTDDGGSVKTTAGNTACDLRLYNASGWWSAGSHWYIYRRTKQNFLVNLAQNWKVFRTWVDPGFTLPQFIISPSNGIVQSVFNTGGDAFWFDSAFNGNQLACVRTPDTTNYHTEEFAFQAASPQGNNNGILRVYKDGVHCLSSLGGVAKETAAFEDPAGSGPAAPNTLTVLMATAANPELWSPPWDGGNITWNKDAYFDTTWARVMIGNASTLSNSTVLAPQIPSAWSTSSITVTLNNGPFAALAENYLYVIDTNGKVNANGFLLSSGSGGIVQTPVGLRAQ